jgi:hypothetical protein
MLKKFLAAAAVGMAAFTLHAGPVRADTSAGGSGAMNAAELVQDVNELPSSDDAAGSGPETPRLHLANYAADRPVTAAAHRAVSSVAILIWAAVIAGLVTTRNAPNRRRRQARRPALSDEELRELLGIRPGARPAT